MKKPLIEIGKTARFGGRVWDCCDVIPVNQDGGDPEWVYAFDGWGDYPILRTETELLNDLKDN